uniref:Putative signal transduction protein enabled n=1 Tax=Triatoma dimidiata TaxID=72491 RepID=A0A0V0GCJ1_TRIDM
MTLNLPVERGDSRSSSDSSTGKTPPQPPPAPPLSATEEGGYSYVQLTTVHEYMYPVMDEGKQPSRTDSGGSLKKRSPGAPQPTSLSKCQSNIASAGSRRKERCRHCQEPFCSEQNVRGSCEYAPDCVKASINAVACISCAQCMLYHCMSDPEGDFVQHPCECGPVDDTCSRRWIGLALLSLVVPCLWCYPPLRACHWCCVSCGLCGGKHTPAS